MRILGLDVGDATIGVAVSDELLITAQGLETIRRTGDERDLEAVADLAREYAVSEIVVGMPVNMDGTIGPQAKKTQEFADALEKHTGIPMRAWDERLTTVAAERVLVSADLSRRKRKRVRDKLAAVMILQSYLDGRGER